MTPYSHAPIKDDALAMIERCDCAECTQRLAGKARAWPATKVGALTARIESDLVGGEFEDGTTAEIAQHYGATDALALRALTDLLGVRSPAGELVRNETDAGRRSGVSVSGRPARFRWFTT